jgi:hypothetical protein
MIAHSVVPASTGTNLEREAPYAPRESHGAKATAGGSAPKISAVARPTTGPYPQRSQLIRATCS